MENTKVQMRNKDVKVVVVRENDMQEDKENVWDIGGC